jgi:hypothetical protein
MERIMHLTRERGGTPLSSTLVRRSCFEERRYKKARSDNKDEMGENGKADIRDEQNRPDGKQS